ncbi:right-handed parallel beta-helix repeat-containing protein [Methylocapsa sp. S129]|uniref:right-handed parallel beta-helix repeat-containing protein n=1 Tax=Methylocapsa sp. S129 TaxID=1641869 RepID=UPI00131CF1BC|nr:right-handed parallel beta-helix repeat-containing protein [Methylocapsa sp. S129]
MLRPLSYSIVVALVLGLVASAHAQANRAWVSGKGTDAAGCGAPISPCRSFQYVHDNIIADGGEIDVLDGAGYGAVTITKAISIVNDGAGTAGVQASSGSAITINASGVVTLRGLNIDGLGTASYGVQFYSGDGLTIVNCVIRHFSAAGVDFELDQSAAKLLISNAIVTDNGYGVKILSTGASASTLIEGTLDHVTASDNGRDGVNVTGSPGEAQVAISNSVMSGNGGNGVNVYGSQQTIVSIDSSQMNNNNNSSYGVYANSSAVVLLRNNMIMNNSTGVGAVSPYVASYSNNAINYNNNTDIQGTITSLPPR